MKKHSAYIHENTHRLTRNEWQQQK